MAGGAVSRIGAAGDLRLLAAGLTAGIVGILLLPRLPSVPEHAALALSALVRWRGRPVWMAAVLGSLLAGWHGQDYLQQRWPSHRHGESIWVEGHVAALPERATQDAGTMDWRFAFAPVASDLPRQIRVSWYRTDRVPRVGDCWRLQLRMRTPHGSLNPGAFDYERWLLRERIGALASVRDAEACDREDPFPVQRFRQSVVDGVGEVLGARRGAALLTALTVGDTSALTDDDWERLRVTGTTHLIAISGFNLGIVAGLAFFVLRWAWALVPALCLQVPAQRVALFGSAAVATAYAALAGFDAPVTRALIMLWVLVLAAAAHRLQQPTRALAVAWVLILLADPFAVLSPGLWLSFGAVLAILYVSTGRLHTPARWRLALTVQLVLSLVLIPLTLHFFQGFAWLSVPVNLVAVPVFTVLTPLALLSVAALAVHPALGQWSVERCGALMEQAYGLLARVADQAPAAWIPASPPGAALALGAIGAVVAFVPRGVPLRWLALPCLAALCLPRSGASPALEVTALDVGQGTAVVVRTRSHVLLFDAGPGYDGGYDAGRSVVVPYLLQAGISRIDRLLLSHTDNDHAGGVAAVRSLLDVARELGTEGGEPCTDGQTWEWDDVRFRLLHPGDGRWSGNNGSCVLSIEGPFRVLLPGDIERAAERHLLKTRRDALAADVLVAPHHGSGTSSTAAFIEAVSPQIVVHSAGWRSRFGHPRADVAARYAQAGAAQYVTGVEGAVTIRQDAGGRLVVDPYRRRAGRWWNATPEP